MITKEQYIEIQSRYQKFEGWRNGRTSYFPQDVPANVPVVTNDERSSLEVYEFCQNPPQKYFLYIDEEKRIATTWTSEKLGVVHFGREFKSSFGDTRMPVTIKAINGRTYHGTYYKSAGDYARVKLSK